MSTGRRLVVLGLKVGDAPTIERWAAEGHLPTIADVMRRGCHGRLAHRTRVCEHGSATTLFTGLPADRHGYHYFRQLVPGSYRLEHFRADNVQARPFWARSDVFSGAVAIIDSPETRTFPDLPGHQLMDWGDSMADLHIGSKGSVPPALREEVHRRFGQPPDLLGDTANGTIDEDREALDRFLGNVRTKGEVCRYVLSLGDPALTVVFFDETHSSSHRYFQYRPEARNGGSDDEQLRNAIRSVYQAVDQELGRILGMFDDDANIVIVSLFGMQEQYPTEGLNTALCRALGYQIARPAKKAGLRPIDIARRVLPERLRFALSKRLPGRRQEALLADLFASGTDWERTTAFSLPSLYTGFIRVNLRGREPQGIVDPAEYDALLERIEADLHQLTDARTGEPVIESVVRTVDVFGGGPPERLPDLFVEWRPGTEVLERVRHPRGEFFQRRPTFCPGSEETVEGFIAACGPDVAGRGTIGDFAPIDFAPTLLSLLGRPKPADMPGNPHGGMLGQMIDA